MTSEVHLHMDWEMRYPFIQLIFQLSRPEILDMFVYSI